MTSGEPYISSVSYDTNSSHSYAVKFVKMLTCTLSLTLTTWQNEERASILPTQVGRTSSFLKKVKTVKKDFKRKQQNNVKRENFHLDTYASSPCAVPCANVRLNAEFSASFLSSISLHRTITSKPCKGLTSGFHPWKYFLTWR